MKSKFKVGIDVWISIILLILAIFMLTLSYKFPDSASRFPKLVLYFTVILSIGVIVESLIKSRYDSVFNLGLPKEKTIPAIKILGMVVVYFILFSMLGFAVSTFLFTLVTARFMGSKNWLANSFLGIGFITFVYIAFIVFLQVPIPMFPKILV